MPHATKEVFLASHDYPTKAWLLRNSEGSRELSEGERLRLDEGREVGAKAREVFPGGAFPAPFGSDTAFEKRIFNYLRALITDLADQLAGFIERLFDLEALIRNNSYHPEFRGSSSIKRTLPVLVPGMGYGDLSIDATTRAFDAWVELRFPAAMLALLRNKSAGQAQRFL